MTLELFLDILQLLVTLAGCGCSVLLYCKSRRQHYFLLTCFYGCFSLGLFYWTIYLLLFDKTPQLLYVTEIAWLSALIFLGMLQYTFSSQEERTFWCPAMWLAPVTGVATMVVYWLCGGVLFTMLRFSLSVMLVWKNIQSLCYLAAQKQPAPQLRTFYIAVLTFVAAEYALWLSSVFWVSDTWNNPYFWFDFLLTAVLAALLPITKRAVEQ